MPPEVARKVAYLEKRTRKSTTEIVVESIERYYATMSGEGGTAAEALEQAGFIGCAINGVTIIISSVSLR